MSFVEKYEYASTANNSIMCIGLDPDRAEMPPGVAKSEFLLRIVEATQDLVCAYKPNSPFFEEDGAEGFAELKMVIDGIHRRVPRVPVILDSKRADIPNTSQFFASSVFGHFNADATVVNPYMGFDALEPFVQHEDRHTFVLCRTSNPGARDFQDLPVGDTGWPLYLAVADRVQKWNRQNVGLVVGATYPADASRVREVCPDRLLLVPGIGKQEGELEAVLRATGDSIIVNSSRSILYAGKSEPDYRTRFAEYARHAAEALHEQLNEARGTEIQHEGALA
ncbi:MAG: orotidine-5'-phosphate decarboxylase [Chloroflexi bacterium]|nr:orotidine-5'-phosphate decarboxylase [Chloroflexota bacterium]